MQQPQQPQLSPPLRILRNYFFWKYERGSFHYDVMVTLILLFLFISPHFIDFHDRPIPDVPPRANEVLVLSSGESGHRFVYEIRADDLQNAHTDADRRSRITQIVDNIGGGQILSIKPVTDPRGHVVAYDASVRR